MNNKNINALTDDELEHVVGGKTRLTKQDSSISNAPIKQPWQLSQDTDISSKRLKQLGQDGHI